MLPLVATGLSAIIPSLLLLWYFHSRDVYPEPPRVLWTTFILGLLSTLPTLLIALPITSLLSPYSHQWPLTIGLLKAFATAALPENLFKFLVLVLYCARHPEFDEPMDGIVYGVAASLGFATLENILYVASGGFSLAVTRAITAVPGHAFLGVIMGYYVGQAKFRPHRRHSLLTIAFFVPTLLHGLYDFPLLTLAHLDRPGISTASAILILLALGSLATEAFFAMQLVTDLRMNQLAKHSRDQRLGPAPELDPVRAVYGWLSCITGALLLCFAIIVISSQSAAFVYHPEKIKPLWRFVIHSFGMGAVPLVFGLFIFLYGVSEINKTVPPVQDPDTPEREAPPPDKDLAHG